MNQTFDFQRFMLLIKLNFAEKGKNYLLTGGLFIGLLLLLLLPIAVSDEFIPYGVFLQVLALVLVVFLGGSVFTSSIFSQYASPSTGIAATMVPGSMLEKFLSALLINLCFTVLLMVMFFALHYFTIDLGNSQLPVTGNRYQHFPKQLSWYFSGIYIVSQGTFVLGSIYFTKFSYLKTAGILFLTLVLTAVVNMWLIGRLVDESISTAPFIPWQISSAKSQNPNIKIWSAPYTVSYPDMVQYLVYAFPVVVLLSLWYISFIRLKEKEF